MRAEHDTRGRDLPGQRRDATEPFHHRKIKPDLPGRGDFFYWGIVILVQNDQAKRRYCRHDFSKWTQVHGGDLQQRMLGALVFHRHHQLHNQPRA